jgi:NAD(P)-dependent dehydrogenase (short-subunit alcohol dehydrogenase family)
VNIDAPFVATKAALEIMRAQKSGAIVNVASVSGQRARAGAGAYCSSKAALIQFTRVAALEAGPFGVRVNAVAPGGTETSSFAAAFANVPAEDMAARGKAASPLGRFGQSDEVAAGICFLLSDEARYITGATLNVDGGASLMR